MNQKEKTYVLRRWTGGLLLCVLAAFFCTACGSGKQDNAQEEQSSVSYRDDVAVNDLRDAVAGELGEDYWPQSALEDSLLQDLTGLKAESYEEALVEMPMISTNVDTLIIVRAKEGQAQGVEDTLNAYRDGLISDTMQYPMNLSKIQASMVKSFGNYVCFVQLGADTSSAMDESEEAAVKHCQEMNGRALQVIEDALKQS